MPVTRRTAYTELRNARPPQGRGDVAMDDLTELAEAIGRCTSAEGGQATAVPELLLARRSAPSEFHPVMYEASLCVVAQGAKEVRLAGESFRYDPAHSLLVAVDLPVAARVVEASLARPCLAVRVSLDAA